ncbi:flagellar biosynthetic protein FliO [Motilimonas pumila]|uniref:Flagellar protein n=1 Tax=Motilimonas pumila TaxID=2303987 RepID=A0A418YGP3_9GAMM|nr:flagellar biosynthetic protein FliO [Motilimonas pumila]RJG49031.1 flagellar biosynthetic protein FliO [Motilimonas pumila]
MKWILFLLAMIASPVMATVEKGVDANFGSVFASLAVVIVVIFIAATLFKKTHLIKHFTGQDIKMVAHLSVGRNEKIFVVQVGEQQYLLGASASQINLLDKLDKPLEVKQGAPANFAQSFSGMMKK